MTDIDTMHADSLPHDDDSLWVLAGRLRHPIYSPKGDLEGLFVDVEDVAVQFVVAHGASEAIADYRPGQSIVLEGQSAPPSPKGDAEHEVYLLHRVVSIDGRELGSGQAEDAAARGTVVRFNYARHGAPNGVVLDTGDFVHTRPEGFESLGFEIGMHVEAHGESRPLRDGLGRVVEASIVNGIAVAPKKPRHAEHAR